MLQTLSHIGGIKAALGAAVDPHQHLFLGRVDGDHRAAHSVIDRSLPVVAPRDDPVTDGKVASTDLDAVAEPAVAL